MITHMWRLCLWLVCLWSACVVTPQDVQVQGNCSLNNYRWFTARGRQRSPLDCRVIEGCPPNSIAQSENFMGEPYSLSLEWNLVNVSGRLNPQLIIDWQPPRAGSGFAGLKGFSIEIHKVIGTGTFTPLCWVFDLSRSNFTAQDYQLHFQKQHIGFHKNGPEYLFLLELYSLPRSKDSVPQREFFRLPILHNTTDPARWSSGISYPSDNVTSKITVRFSLAPSQYGFVRYTAKLVSSQDDRNYFKKCEIYLQHSYECQGKTIEPPGPNATHIDHTFYDLPGGLYQVWIQPYDIYYQNDKCQCYYKSSNGDDRVCDLCITTVTGWITVEGPPPATTSGPITKPQATVESTVEVPDANVGESTSSNHNGPIAVTTIIAAALGSLLGLILVMLLGCWAWRRTRTGSESLKEIFVNGHLSQAVPKKTVYILHVKDHDLHETAVSLFATYLENHCNCTVLFPPWFQEPIRTMESLTWHIKHMDEADYILIINSEAAFNLHDSRNNNSHYKMEDEGPEGDVFSPSLTHVMTKSKQQDFYKKIILAYFVYTPEEFILKDIHPGIHYQIPKHFKNLLYHIHEVETFRPDPRQREVDAMEILPSRFDGQNLLEAITKAKFYQKAHPDWFNKRFVRQDSAYSSTASGNSYEQEDEMSDSISRRAVSPSLAVADNVAFDDSDSTYTITTKYIMAQGRGSVIAPSDLDTVATSEIQERLAGINRHMDEEVQDSGYFNGSSRLDSEKYASNYGDGSYPQDGCHHSGMCQDSVLQNHYPENVKENLEMESKNPHVCLTMHDGMAPAPADVYDSDEHYIQLDDWHHDDGRDV